MYWTLFAVHLLTTGAIDYEKELVQMHGFETRYECESIRAKVLEMIPAPPLQDLRCLKTDQI